MLTVIPAYGRDYKSAAVALADWDAGRDFKIADCSSPWDGSYVNKADHPGPVRIRYAKLRKVCVAGGGS